MARRTTKLAVTAVELRAKFDDFKKKQRRFNAVAAVKRASPESELDSAATDTEAAFKVVYTLLLRATGSKNNQACAAIFPDGSLLIAGSVADDYDGDEWLKLQLVPATRVATLA